MRVAAQARSVRFQLVRDRAVALALDVSDRVYVRDGGSVVHHATAPELRADEDVQAGYCSSERAL